MWLRRDKTYSYEPVPNLSDEDGVDAEDHGSGGGHGHQPPKPFGKLLVELLWRLKLELLMLILIFTVLVVYPVLEYALRTEDSAVEQLPKRFDEEMTFKFHQRVKDKAMACQLPRLDPFDPSIRHLITEPKYINCTDKTPLLFRSTFNSTLVSVRSGSGAGAEVDHVQECAYASITRGDNQWDPDNDFRQSKGYPISIENASVTVIPPEHEFLLIWCLFQNGTNVAPGHPSTNVTPTPIRPTSSDNDTYTKTMDMHVFVPEKPAVENRVNEYYRQQKKNMLGKVVPEKDRVNVVILGIDAVSHMNFIRNFQETYLFLMGILSAVEMHGYNKVGHNTYPNLVPALTSMNTSELESTCVEHKAYDECPFIWKKYAAKGFRTSYGEDSTWMGIFNYLTDGFRTPPTDYYLRPFGVAAEKHIATFRTGNAKLCYGPRLSFEVLLDYMRKMAFSMGSHKRYFQLIWATSLTHDYLNDGRMGDKHLLSTLKWFKEEGHLNQTVFILMSDHGIHWGKITNFLQGKLEQRLPFLYFVMPEWFQKKYGRAFRNLKLNRDRLSTPFDLHETLLDLLDLGRLKNDTIIQREKMLKGWPKHDQLPRGISQFLPIPLSRTCDMAGIPEHFCTCHRRKEVEKQNPEVKDAAGFIVSEINSKLSANPKCANLSLVRIETAYLIDFGFNTTKLQNGKGYELMIRTSPGDATFEASLIKRNTSSLSNSSWTVSGTIGRSNLYGNQSHCVNERELKPYCYCNEEDVGIFKRFFIKRF